MLDLEDGWFNMISHRSIYWYDDHTTRVKVTNESKLLDVYSIYTAGYAKYLREKITITGLLTPL